jgi:hypothetical protein
LEETDSAPGCADGAGHEGGVEQDARGEGVEGYDGGAVEFFIRRNRKEDEYGGEEAGEAREDADPVG